jgi:hypothetical protein
MATTQTQRSNGLRILFTLGLSDGREPWTIGRATVPPTGEATRQERKTAVTAGRDLVALKSEGRKKSEA